jgi:hypothetical protein
MEQLITAVVNGIVVPITSVIPVLVSSGLLLLAFAVLWVAFGVAVVRRQASLDDAWDRLRGLPIVVQGLAWLLFLPVVLGLAIWRRPWQAATRLFVIAGIAGWNLLVLLPA